MNQLQPIFDDLGISQYLDAFIDQGFDTWETILDITESDLDALGVKLGHRRKLQRRIANYRGVNSVESLLSPARASIEDASANANKVVQSTENKDGTAVTKRKYRRHPKPDENAPERPPSAYVLFSNKMREDLKDQNLSFTEIAKLVGENWQNLTRAEKAPYETKAQEAKDKYNREMAVYKTTEEYHGYNEYLQEFRKRQAMQDTEASKRMKIQMSGLNGVNGVVHGSGSSSESRSESQTGSEPPPSRQHRVDSITSQPDSATSPGYQWPGRDDPRSPRSIGAEHGVPGTPRGVVALGHRDEPGLRSHTHSDRHDSHRNSVDSSHYGRPWLAGANDVRNGAPPPISQSPEGGIPSLTGTVAPSNHNASRLASGSTAPWSRPPSLKTEKSSSGSISSIGSYPAPRTPSEGSLPIHALLSSKPDVAYTPPVLMQPSLPDPLAMPIPAATIHQDPGRPPGDLHGVPRGPTSSNNGAYSRGQPSFLPPVISKEPSHIPLAGKPGPAVSSRLPGPGSVELPSLDGMSALLRASDIVGRPE